MKKDTREILREGDVVTAEFLANKREGKKPIVIINGMVGFVDKTYRGEFLQPRSIWQFEVMRIEPRTLIVMPIQKLKTPTQNLKEIDEKMKKLVTKHAPKHKKQKVNYPYKSNNERM